MPNNCHFKGKVKIHKIQSLLCSIQVVPGQAGGGSFKFETLIAYRAEQRLCISSHLISAYLSFSDFHSSSQLFSALCSSCKLILRVLISSLIFSHLLSSSHRILTSSHLFSGPKPAPKTDLGAKASNPSWFLFGGEGLAGDFLARNWGH